ncbi:hypothetical protein GY50_1135 [Dehalococcoides mccartyi GY50]|nr:hypothetical protein GY50_1135 [Dehalococcoides mccartyi GY50]
MITADRGTLRILKSYQYPQNRIKEKLLMLSDLLKIYSDS